MYWTAKLHKDPYSQRFITSGRDASTQPLSIYLGYCLKTILNIIQSNNNFSKKKSKINKCFIIENRNPVLNHIKQNNISNKVQTVSTYDFKTLYTSIPHDKLKQSLSTTVRSVFNSRKKKFITVIGKKAFLTDEKKTQSFSISINQFLECINFLIDENYITYKGEIFKQCIGIPMGTNCAPYLANIFLHTYEDRYINHLIATDQIDTARSLSDMFRYQDDCIIFNDRGIFSQHWKAIYPNEMQLEKTSTGSSCTLSRPINTYCRQQIHL